MYVYSLGMDSQVDSRKGDRDLVNVFSRSKTHFDIKRNSFDMFLCTV